jgi:hypothetical protein
MDDLCSTCGGTPHPSGLPCICNDIGTRDAEVNGLRRYAFALERAIGTVRPALKWIANHAPDPDPHALAEHAEAALAAIAKAKASKAPLSCTLTIHIVLKSRVLCKRVCGEPATWPVGHGQVNDTHADALIPPSDPSDYLAAMISLANCEDCIAEAKRNLIRR